jgi:hypothetical protein
VYGSTVAVGTSDLSNVAIYDDTGSFQDSVSVSGIKNVALYDSVLAAQTDSTVYIFEKISSAWSQTATYSQGTFTNVKIYSNWIVAGNEGKCGIAVLYIHCRMCFVLFQTYHISWDR